MTTTSATETVPEVGSAPEFVRDVARILSLKQLASLLISMRYTVALWVGAVSAGKTFVTCLRFLIAVRRAPTTGTIVMIGKTLRTIEQNVLSQLMDPALFGRLAAQTVHTTGASYAIILGRRVELIGANNREALSKIQGATYSVVYVDEATLLPSEEFFAMLLTRLRGRRPVLIATTNPASKNHWLRRSYILNAAAHDMVVFHLTMLDNPSLSKAYIRRMIRGNVGAFFQRMILGLWTNAEGAVYPHWNEREHVIRWEDMPPIDRILGVGIDAGTNHAMSAIMVGITAERDRKGMWTPRLILMDELRLETTEGQMRLAPSEQARRVAEWLAQSYRHNPHDVIVPRPNLVFVDPAAAWFSEELRSQRIPGLALADNSLSEGIADISSLLAKGRLVVTDRCWGWLKEVSEYTWDPKKTEQGKDEPINDRDDSLAAGRYSIRSTKPMWQSLMRTAYGLSA